MHLISCLLGSSFFVDPWVFIPIPRDPTQHIDHHASYVLFSAAAVENREWGKEGRKEGRKERRGEERRGEERREERERE